MKRKIRKLISICIFYLYNRFTKLIYKIDDNKILFLSESHSTLDGNLKYMYEYIIGKNYKIKVYTKGDRRESDSISTFFAIMRDMTTSKYIFLDDFYGLTSAMKIREGQKLIQLWHGAGAYKKFGYSRDNNKSRFKILHTGYKKYTNVSVSSKMIKFCYSEAFGINIKNVKAFGVPRTDLFYQEQNKNKIKSDLYSRFPEFANKKLVLIAPTYRGDKVEDAYYDFDKLNIRRIVDNLGKEYVVAVKWHSALQNNLDLGLQKNVLPNNVYDLSNKVDINELILITDILVTDYSSIIFDYYLTGRPIVYFPYDLNEYMSDRGLYFNFEKYIYGKVAQDTDSLISAIRDEDLCLSQRTAFKRQFMNACDGESTRKIYNWVFNEEINSEQ